MRYLSKIATVGFAALILGACSLLTQQQAEVEPTRLEGVDVISYPGSVRGAYVFHNNGVTTVCSEPGPDVALSTASEISADLKATLANGQNVDGKAAAEFSAEVVALAGRTQLVLVARDMLFALCVLSQSGNHLDPEATRQIFNEIAEVVVELAKADRVSAQADADRALVQLASIEKEVAALISAQDRMVERILFVVTDKNRELIMDKLIGLVDDGGITGSVKQEILEADSAGELETILKEDADSAIEPMFNAIKDE